MATETQQQPKVEYALEMRGIGKRFGEQWVLRHVDYLVQAGSVHALVGHNGAGKSTLMKIALGGYSPTEGTVRVGGVDLSFDEPAESRRLGLGMVLQERSLISTLDGLDNIFLNAERTSALHAIRRRSERREAAELCSELGISLDVLRKQVIEMSPVEQQMVEIAKALRLGRKVLILDEPTAPLSHQEIALLFEVIRHAAALGTGIVLITHHLNEVFAVSDHVTCLREGSVTLSEPTTDTKMADLVEAILGRPGTLTERKLERKRVASGTKPMLELDRVAIGTKLTGITFSVHPGEILGIAGLAGSGRTTLLRTIFGDRHATAGAIRLDGRPYDAASPAEAISKRVYLIPESRAAYGLVLTTTITENVALPVLQRLSPGGIFRSSRARSLAQRLMGVLHVQARGPKQIVGELSGGNQQKVVVSKALAADAKLLLLDEPTFGVDIGAAAELIRHVRSLADDGAGVVWSTSDLQELLEVSDRIVVLADGGIRRIVNREDHEFNEAYLVEAMQRTRFQEALEEARTA